MIRTPRILFCASAMLVFAALHGHAQSSRIASSTEGGRTLIWSDEFNGPNGSAPDAAKWTIVRDGSGFGNNELEYYTRRTSNIREQNGSLIITARQEHYTGPDGISRPYTSGRIESRGRFELKYGRIEARIRIPQGQGVWPAFWMMGGNFDRIGWPACGEIDIMENVGFEPSTIHGSLHGPGYSGSNPLSGKYTLPNKGRFSDGYHVFAIEWEPRQIRFYVDDILYETRTPRDVPAGENWAFDHPFYIVLDLAVGGYWPGVPDATTHFPATMLVDYVRVYRLGEERADKEGP